MSDPAITVQNINKTFKLPHEKQNSIKGAFVNIFRFKKTRSYEAQTALSDISFEVKKGEFFGIIGRNGSGKSTLLKLLAGIYSPDNGSIKIKGNLTPFIELGVGFNPELTGRENVYLNGALLGFSRRHVEHMYDDIVAFAELERFMDQKLKNYSSGMQVRLAFSIAIRAKSDILLIDEVLAVGDIAFQEKCFKTFEEIKKSGTTVVFISHDGGVIERFCDRVAIIDQTKLIDIGDPTEMVLQYGAMIAGAQINNAGKIKNKEEFTKGVKVKNYKVLDKNGKPVDSIVFGEPFTVAFEISSKSPAKNTVVGIDIIDSQGVSINGPNTKESRIKVDLDGVTEVRATFPSNPLSPGMYNLTFGVFNHNSTFAYDLVEHVLEFKILGKQRHGKIYIEPSWSVKQIKK